MVEFQHVKPGKGGAFVRTKLRNVKTGAVVERTFNAGVKVGLAIVERKDMQYLYRDGESLTFMDMTSYEQIPRPGRARRATARAGSRRSDRRRWRCTRGPRSASSCRASGHPRRSRRPNPAVKGDTRTGAMKPAVLETGADDAGAAVRRGGRDA